MARELAARKVHFFPLLENSTYDTTPLALKWANELTTTNEYTEVQFLGDGTIEHDGKKLDKVAVTLSISSQMPNKDLAKLCGYEYNETTGAMVITTDSVAIKGALAFEIKMSDGSTKRRVLYNCSLYKNETSNNTDATGEDSLYTFEGNAIPVEINGKEIVELTIASADIEAMTEAEQKKTALEKYNSFFEAVVLP